MAQRDREDLGFVADAYYTTNHYDTFTRFR
jgi:guanyl-specific ribonuclease Sa